MIQDAELPPADARRVSALRLSGLSLVALPFGICTFVLVATGLTLGVATLVAVIGWPILLATLVRSDQIAGTWRRLLRWAIDADLPEPVPPIPPSDDTLLRHLGRRLREPRTATQAIFHLLVALPVGILGFTLCVVVWLVAFPVAPAILRRFWMAVGWMVRPLLTDHPSRRRALEGRIVQLAESRARSVDAAQAERRRIERDLHDGAQARLVGLAMELGRARERLARGAGTDEAALMVAEAHEESKRALAELRALVRGIHPAVLSDRGLDAALSSLAAASPVPVDVDVHLEPRPSQAVETIAYFVVAEALTNVARHSGARHADVTVRRDGDLVRIRVADDGVGGADAARGTGLGGLGDRVASVDGSLVVTSPAGGGTLVEAELPCAS